VVASDKVLSPSRTNLFGIRTFRVSFLTEDMNPLKTESDFRKCRLKFEIPNAIGVDLKFFTIMAELTIQAAKVSVSRSTRDVLLADWLRWHNDVKFLKA